MAIRIEADVLQPGRRPHVRSRGGAIYKQPYSLEAKEMRRLFLLGVGMLIVVACMSSLASPAAESSFREAMSALQSNDFAKALHCLELSVADDPENVRYASVYRHTIIRLLEYVLTI